MDTIGSRIKFIRKREGLKQIDFAKRVLVSASYISKVESGKELPSDIFTKLVALEFNVSYLWLKDGVGNIQIIEKEYDYFERHTSNEQNNRFNEMSELNASIQNFLQINNTFRTMCISEICYDLSEIIQLDISDNKKDLIVEILADYLGSIEELTQKLYMLKNIKDYQEKSSYYISSYIKDIKKLFYDLSNLLQESDN